MVLGALKNRVLRWLRFGQNDTGWAQRIQRDQQRLTRTLPILLKPHFNCIDVGAHQGAFLRDFLKYCPEGQHLAFEPLPHMYESLVRDFPSVKVYDHALSNSSGNQDFYKVKNAMAWSGLAPQDYPLEVDIEKIKVKVQNLDKAVPHQYRPHFIKIDVEGAELLVLQGGSALIGTYRPTILFEHAAIHTSSFKTSPEQVFDFFDDHNMDILRLDLNQRYNKSQFVDIYHNSKKTNYDHAAETNFIAAARPA